MSNEQFKKQISAIVETQIKITEHLSGLVKDFGAQKVLEDIIKWLSDNQLSNTEIVEYYVANIKEDNNEIVIICDSMVQREKIKNFLETEIFTDSARYSAAVENL